MSWVTVTWSISAGACLTLAFLQFIVWWKDRAARANLVFALGAAAVAVFAGLELALMRAETPAQFNTVVRWIHVPAWVIMVSIVAFVRLYLNAGRRWLAWTVVAVRTLALILNFVLSPNINYRKITGIRHMPFLGEPVSVPLGVPNPWMLVAQFSLLLLIIFVVDATITVWRRGYRRQALVVGGSIVLLVLLASGQAVAMTWGILSTPLTVSLFYLIFVAAMAYELSYDLIHAAQIMRRLQVSEAELREEHQRMDLATAAAELGIWVWDVARNEIWISEKGRVLLGLPPSEKLNIERFQNAIHPDDRESLRRAVESSLSTGREYEAEHRVQLPDGQVRWLAARGRVEFDTDGKPVRMRGVSADVTKRKLGEQAVRESEERFRTMANTAPVMIWMSGLDKLCTFFNKAWLDFTGRTVEQEKGNGWAEGVHTDDLQRCLKIYTEAFDARQPFEMQYRLRRHDGEHRWISDNGVPRYDSQQNFLGYIGSCIDITELLSKKEALREFEERVRLAAQAAHLGVWELDCATNEMWMSDSARALLQFDSEAHVTHAALQDRVHPDDRADRDSAVKAAIETGGEYETEYRVLLPDGNVRWIGGRGRCVAGQHGKGTRLIGVSMDVTSQKQTQELFRLATEASPSGMLLVDEQGRIVLVNAHIEELFGYQRDELVGKLIEILVPERFVAGHPAHRTRFFAAPEPRALGAGRDLFARRKDGSEFPVEIAVNPVRTPEGTLVLATVIDITERKQAEEKFRLAVEASPSGILIVDQTGQIVLVNSQIEELFGYGREELIGQSVEILVPERFAGAHPKHRGTFFAAPAARAMGAGRELFARRKNGSEFPVEIGLNPIQSPEGMLILAAVVDISERKRAEEKFRMAVEASPSGILLVNQAGHIVLVNSQIEELFGYGREELIGQSVDILVPERFAGAHPEHRGTFFAAPATRAMGAGRELFARRKDGSEFPVEIGLNPIQSPEGILVLAAIVDISARLEAEEEARHRREQVELLSRVSLLGEMTASLAHELNQPLAAIMNNASAAKEYIEQDRLDPTQLQEILTDVIGDGRRAFDIIRNVRSAIKKGSAIRGRINVNDLVKAVTHMVYPDAAAHFCTVETSLARGLPAIEGDPTQIQQVLLNLLRNAFDAMNDTPPSRRVVRIATSHDGDKTISVAVRDHGCGISEKTRERLFEQFFTTKEEGLGMGLAIVRSIVEAHGGTIAAENADGGGARFHFRLPASAAMPQ